MSHGGPVGGCWKIKGSERIREDQTRQNICDDDDDDDDSYFTPKCNCVSLLNALATTHPPLPYYLNTLLLYTRTLYPPVSISFEPTEQKSEIPSILRLAALAA